MLGEKTKKNKESILNFGVSPKNVTVTIIHVIFSEYLYKHFLSTIQI